MQNIGIEVKGKVLTITIDLSVKGNASASGKSLVLASTKGNVEIPGAAGVKLGVNVYKAK